MATTVRPAAPLSKDDLARLTEAALDVILQHGTVHPSVDLELDLWRALNRAHDAETRMTKWRRLTGARIPSRQELLSSLVATAYQVALGSGADSSDLPGIAQDLLFAFELVGFNSRGRAVLAA
jgi:hypothetical protein